MGAPGIHPVGWSMKTMRAWINGLLLLALVLLPDLPEVKLPANRTLLIGGIAALLICGGALGAAAIVLLGMFLRKKKTSRG